MATDREFTDMLHPPSRLHSPRRPSNDSHSHHDSISVYEDANENPLGYGAHDTYDALGGMDVEQEFLASTSQPLFPPPGRVPEPLEKRVQSRKWWFGVKEAMRGHLQHLIVQADASSLLPEIDRPGHGIIPSDAGVAAESAFHADAIAKSKSVTRSQVADEPYAGTDLEGLSTFHQLKTGYHAHLLKLAPLHPESLTLVHYALRCLGGRWSVERQACVRDEVFHISILPGRSPKRTHLDCTNETQFEEFRHILSTPRRDNDNSVNILLLPDLSPIVVEQVGGLLKVDHRVFTNHIWSTRRRPFSVPNRHGFDARANTEAPEGCTTTEVHTYADMFLSGGGSLQRTEKEIAKARWLWHFRAEPQAYHFLDRQFDKWPAAISPPSDVRHELSMSFYASSRATVYCFKDKESPIQVLILLTPSSSWAPEGSSTYSFTTMGATVHCRDEGDPFLQSQPYIVSPNMSRTLEEEERYCGEIERFFTSTGFDVTNEANRYVNVELCMLNWLASKFVSAALQLLSADMRRLAFFRHSLASRRTTSEVAGNDLLRDLRHLRDKAAHSTNAASALEFKLQSLVDVSPSCTTSTKLHSCAQSTLRSLRSLQRRLTSHIGAIAATQTDISSSLAHTLTLLQLEESRKSIAQNAAVKRLTILAFVWIPISSTTSAFGMNISELLANPPPAWSFVVCALAVSMLMLAFAAADWAANVLAGVETWVGLGIGGRKSGVNAGDTRAVSKLAHRVVLAMTRTIVRILRGLSVMVRPFKYLVTGLKKLHDEGSAIRKDKRHERERFVQHKMDAT